MKILDFLFYCNIKWILKYSETETKKAYAGSFASIYLAIMFLIWGTTILRVVQFLVNKAQLSFIHLITIDLLALLLFLLLRYMYVTKGRLNLMYENNTPIYNISDKAAIKFVFVTNTISILLFIGVPIVLNIIR